MGLSLPDDGLTEEQFEFRDSLRRFFEANAGVEHARRALEGPTGIEAPAWQKAHSEMGLANLAIPKRFGGQGFAYRDLGVALSEGGRVLAPLPLFGVAALVVPVVSTLAPTNALTDELRPVGEGRVSSLAAFEDAVAVAGAGAPFRVETSASSQGAITGEKRFVLDGDVAETFFVLAGRAPDSNGGDLGLYSVSAADPGVTIRRLESLDPTRRLFRVIFDSAMGRLVGAPPDAAGRLESALDISTALLCSEMVGGMERVLETAVDHATSRFQFGRAIGSFQAIKHKAADMLIDFEGARTATRAALDTLDDPKASREERSIAVSVAKAHVSAAFVRTATESIQIQGGVGYTWEYDAHLYFRRAQSSSLLLGDPVFHEERLASRLAFELAAGRAV